MKYHLMALGFLVLFGCMQEESPSFPKTIAEKHAFTDCNIWVEVGDGGGYIRIGYSGACSRLTIGEYARHMGEMFREFDVNKTRYPGVKKIYINSYRTDGALNDELLEIINRDSVWGLNEQVCDERNLNREFEKFNTKEKYLSSLEKIIENNFVKIDAVEFNGILPYTFKGSAGVISKCYPDSFGVAIYHLGSRSK